MFNWLKSFFYKLVSKEKSEHRLLFSFLLGNFIAWLPIIPLQTPLIFILGYLLRFNITVTFATVYLINNPFTLIPIYILDYLVGTLLLQTIFKINMSMYNPSWVIKFNNFLDKYIDLTRYAKGGFCFWCLMIGGLILAIITSIILYYVTKPVFHRLIIQAKDHENNNSK